MAVQAELIADEVVEPLPGIGPLTGALQAFADFFGIDPDLVQAAAESGASGSALSADDLRTVLAALPENEKTEFLLRVVDGDRHVAAELRRKMRRPLPAHLLLQRTAGVLWARAQEIANRRERADAERREVERRRQAKQAERERRARLRSLKQHGAAVWREIEDEIERRNSAGNDRATSLLCDLHVLAVEEGSQSDFARRLAAIRARHGRKVKLIERLNGLGAGGNDAMS